MLNSTALTRDDVRAALKRLANATDQDTAMGVLKKYGGAGALSKLAENKFAAVIEAAKKKLVVALVQQDKVSNIVDELLEQEKATRRAEDLLHQSQNSRPRPNRRRFIVTYSKFNEEARYPEPMHSAGILLKEKKRGDSIVSDQVLYFESQGEAEAAAQELTKKLPTQSFVFVSEVLFGGCVVDPTHKRKFLDKHFYAPRP